MIETIISNNCLGGAISHSLGLEFKSPTINTQILPEEYPNFCKYLRYYMNSKLEWYTNLSERHIEYIKRFYGCIPNIPFGKVGDIVLCFQHYNSFEDAEAKWNERKRRIDYDHIGYIFHAADQKYDVEVSEFLKLDLPNKLTLTENFDHPGALRFDVPEKMDAFTPVNGKAIILQATDYEGWIKEG